MYTPRPPLRVRSHSCAHFPASLEDTLQVVIVHDEFLLVHAIEMLLDAVLVLRAVRAQRTRIHGRQAALDALVPPARVLGLVGASAAMAPIDGRAVLVGGAEHVQRIDGGRCNGRSGGGLLVLLLLLVNVRRLRMVLVGTGDGDRGCCWHVTRAGEPASRTHRWRKETKRKERGIIEIGQFGGVVQHTNKDTRCIFVFFVVYVFVVWG